MDQFWKLIRKYKSSYQPDVDAGLEKLRGKMRAADQGPPSPAAGFRRWWLVVILVLALGSLALFLWWRSAPATYATRSAETKVIELKDDIAVVLNENSLLHVDRRANTLFLRGEAYFDIQPRPDAPLIIETDHTTVEVLGTAFNLRAVPREGFTEVEMVKGRVAFRDKERGEEKVLRALERGRCWTSDKGMTVEPAPHGSAHYWRTRRASFINQPLSLILPEMERHFGLDIRAEDRLLDCEVTLMLDGSEVQEVFRALERILDLRIDSLSPHSYVLKGKGCPESDRF